MLVIWLPRWKCSRLRQSGMPRSFSSCSARTASVADSPNFERYPPDDFQRPDPRLASFTRRPMETNHRQNKDNDDQSDVANAVIHAQRIVRKKVADNVAA